MISFNGATQPDSVFMFGGFCLSPNKRLLLEHGQPVSLGSCAFDILVMLVERRGELFSKEELTARVWTTTVVVATNLTVQVTALRRALGDGRDGRRYILNELGRGYRFVAPLVLADETELSLPTLTALASSPRSEAPALMRIVRLCHEFVEEAQRRASASKVDEPLEAGIATPSWPQSERMMLATTLRRGIRALELARTLVVGEGLNRQQTMRLPKVGSA